MTNINTPGLKPLKMSLLRPLSVHSTRILARRLTTKSTPQRNDLSQLLSRVIKVTGPLSVSMFMRQCLTHPEHGYYTSRDPLGIRGDFVTSPEISQMFGEIIGIWFFALWDTQGRPRDVNFVEFGPGRGTLMFDVMRSFQRLIRKRAEEPVKVDLVMVEASHVLREKQASLLGDSDLDVSEAFWKAKHRWGGRLTWVDTEKDVWDVTAEKATNYIIAHEFFDALPINQFVKTEDGWREMLVDEHPDTGEFCLVKTPTETPACLVVKANPRYAAVKTGSVVEISPDTHAYTKTITQLVTRNNGSTGAALIIDYGPSNAVPNNTLRGIKDHKFVNPFEDPGEVDLSADVDFQAVAQAARETTPVDIMGPLEQGDFLTDLGINVRAQQLLKVAKTEEQKEVIMSGLRRLVEKDGDGMGKIYKFLGILPKEKS